MCENVRIRKLKKRGSITFGEDAWRNGRERRKH
jgi:hypothetical protein